MSTTVTCADALGNLRPMGRCLAYTGQQQGSGASGRASLPEPRVSRLLSEWLSVTLSLLRPGTSVGSNHQINRLGKVSDHNRAIRTPTI